MAITILPANPPGLGQSLATGLGSGLQQLAALKLQELQNQRASQQLQNVFGFTPQEASFFAQKENQPLFLEYLKRGGGTQQMPQTQDLLSPLREMQSPEQVTQQGLQNILQSLGQQPYGKPQQIQQPQQAPIAAQQPEQLQSPKKLSVREQFAQPTAVEKRELKKLELAERKAKAQEEQFERKEARIQQQEIDKATEPYYQDTLKGLKAAQESDKRLGRMSKILEKGDIGGPLRNTFIKAFSEGILGPHGPKIDLNFLMTADAQEFNKLTKDFVKGAKEFFPGRVTDTDVKLFLETIPSLSMTKEGMNRVIRSLESANKASRLRAETMEKIIQENGSRRPRDLELLVEKSIGTELDKLYAEFINAPLGKEEFGAGVFKY